jgi:hypothetical protein
MLKRVLAITLASLLVNAIVSVQPASAGSKSDEQAQFIEKLRQGIARLGVGRDAVVEVKLRDKTRLAGYIDRASEGIFVVANVKTGESRSVAYADVTQVKGHNLSTGAKIAIGIGIGVGIALIVLAIYLGCCTG